MDFTSQICTTKEQSERLLALGLKKETADMCWTTVTLYGTPVTYPAQDVWLYYSIISDTHFPAWSLHRLIEMIPTTVPDNSSIIHNLMVDGASISYYYFGEESWEIWRIWNDKELYDNVIDCIKWLIGEGHFNKKYLEE